MLAVPVLALAEGDWQSTDIDGQAALVQDSLDTIKDASWTSDVRPQMAFVCDAGGIAARIDWQRFISSFSTEVGFKVDGGKFTWQKWKVDGSEAVTYSAAGAETDKLIETLTAGESLLVEITPYSEGPVEARFVLTGLGEGLAALRDSCM